MALYLFFNFFGDSIQSIFEKEIYGFNECSFDFSFLFFKKLNGKKNAGASFDDFFWMMFVDAHDSLCKNVGCVVDNVHGIMIVRGDYIGNLVLKNS